MIREGHPEEIGFKYSNVVPDDTKKQPDFNYLSVNKETGVKLMPGNTVTLTFAFQDWKYLSKNMTFPHVETDSKVLNEGKEGFFEIDFLDLVKSDELGQSRYEVAGRVYFETNIKGQNWNSFMSNGFFEREGWVEPQRELYNFPVFLYIVLPILIFLLLLAIGCYCRKLRKIKKENQKLEEIQKKKDAQLVRNR